MKTIMSVNHLSIYRAALTWYLEKEVKEMFLRHETLDLFDKCPEMDSVLFIKILHWNSRAGDRFSRSRILETCGSGTIVCNPTSVCT